MSMAIRLPDFNAMVALHQQDPEAFEEFRRHLLRQAIDEAPLAHRARLERLIERIEAVHAAAPTPMEAAVAASRLMQESMAELLSAWGQARYAVAGLQATLVLQRYRH
jgi:hypothetical protein